MTNYTGGCSCGAVQVEVTGEPAVMAVCHCTDCRGWSAAPVTGACLWAPENVSVTQGEDKLGSYAKVEGHDRKWCVECGGHVFVDHRTTYGLIDVYGSILNEFKFAPKFHVYYEHSILPIKDGLPKFKDFPTDFGGSGDLLAE